MFTVLLPVFQLAATAILNSRDFKFLTVGSVTRVEMHHYAKFRQKVS